MTAIGTLLSVNIAMPAKVLHGGREVETGFFKKPAEGRLALSASGLAGDGQADLVNHGGTDKAVCVYPAVHFDYWASEWGMETRPGAFGENFTVSELTEHSLAIGDVVRVGDATLQVSQPRQPCFKLGMRHNRPELPLQVQRTGYTGFYFRVLREGHVGAGDKLRIAERHALAVTLAEANRVMHIDKTDAAGIRRLLSVTELSASWRETLTARLSRLETDPN